MLIFVRSDKIHIIRSNPDADTPRAAPYLELFRADPIPIVPKSFSSIVSSAPQTPLSHTRVSSGPETDLEIRSVSQSTSDELEVEVYEWEELPKDTKNIEEWTEAKNRGHKKTADRAANANGGGKRGGRDRSRERERDGKDLSSGSKKEKEKRKRGGVKHKKDYGVREMKPRPCHSHFLSMLTHIHPVLVSAMVADAM